MFQGPKLKRLGRNEGADGERVGAFLDRELADVAIVLHDLRVPGSRANIDHVLIAPSGVWVVDSRLRTCAVSSQELGFVWRRERRLQVDSRDRATIVNAMGRQLDLVESAVAGREPEVPIRAALCFDSTNWGRIRHPFWIGGVLVTYPGDLVERVRKEGPLDDETVGWIAARLALDLGSKRLSSPPRPA